MTRKRKIILRHERQQEFEDTPIQDLITRYLENVRATARSRSTYVTYRNSLGVFSYWLETLPDGLQTPITHFKNDETLNPYYIWLDLERENKQVTIVHHKRQMRTFFYWLMDKKLMPEFEIRIVEAQEEVPKFYSDEELKKLTARPDINDDFATWRNYTIILLILATGNRRGTIVGYSIRDFNFKTNTITMNKNKNKLGQQIPMHENLRKPLLYYINSYRKGADLDEPMFPNEFDEPLNPNSLTHAIAAYNKKRGVNRTSMHDLRHTFARNWVRNGGDSLQLQRMLGHSTLAMTEKYVRLFREDLTAAVNQFATIKTIEDIIEKPARTAIRKRGAKAK